VIKYLWPLFNIVQLLLCFIAFNLALPANVTEIFGKMKDSIEMNFIPKEKILEFVKEKASPLEGLIDRIQSSGGLLVLIVLPTVLVLLVVTLLLVRCSKSPKCKCILKIVEKIKAKFMFGIPLRACITSFIGLCIASGLGRNLSDDVETIRLNIPILVIIFAILGGTIYFVRFTEPERFEDEDF